MTKSQTHIKKQMTKSQTHIKKQMTKSQQQPHNHLLVLCKSVVIYEAGAKPGLSILKEIGF